MAIVTTTVDDLGIPSTWDILPGAQQDVTAIPRSVRTYSGNNTVPAKILTDTSHYQLRCFLPVNFVYRLIALQMTVLATGTNAIQDFSPGMMVQISLSGFRIRHYPIYSLTSVRTGGEGFQWSLTAAQLVATGFALEPTFGASYNEPMLVDDPTIAGQIIVDYIDPSADATEAIEVRHWLRVLQYDIAQFYKYPMNFPVPMLQL